ncbi:MULTISPECIES: xanthine phosphoribosyltransferase [Methanocalculus]|uniref:xanthine phosphoribosyltransferase n=1 Tax=Methanocalculus TaxID=71151 RepID=UPI00209FA5CA|nr:xanthine phosphoribosyltransferase [Methanocalculus sp. AMF5]MCP1663183.1 xanthine phosphoribosyltransferase [Methanocalculus sp. AMF5]
MMPKRGARDELADRIRTDATAGADGLIRMQSFIHHTADSGLLDRCGSVFAEHFRPGKPTKILTGEVSGILAALPAGIHLDIPVLIARKEVPKTFPANLIEEKVISRTKGRESSLSIISDHLNGDDRVLIIDDVLARGETVAALIRLAVRAGAEVVGVGVLVEKVYEGGRQQIRPEIPVHALCSIQSVEGGVIQIADDTAYDTAYDTANNSTDNSTDDITHNTAPDSS